MENNNQIAVGLDIGTTKIVAMVGRKNEFGKLEILGIGRAKSLGVHRGVVTNITNTVNSITEAVKKRKKILDTRSQKLPWVLLGSTLEVCNTVITSQEITLRK